MGGYLIWIFVKSVTCINSAMRCQMSTEGRIWKRDKCWG